MEMAPVSYTHLYVEKTATQIAESNKVTQTIATQIAELEKKDKRNKEIATENTVCLLYTSFTANDLKMGTFLEPSAGIGGFLPVGDMATHRTAFEKDLLTGLVLSALHPDTQVFIEGFETIDSLSLIHI